MKSHLNIIIAVIFSLILHSCSNEKSSSNAILKNSIEESMNLSDESKIHLSEYNYFVLMADSLYLSYKNDNKAKMGVYADAMNDYRHKCLHNWHGSKDPMLVSKMENGITQVFKLLHSYNVPYEFDYPVDIVDVLPLVKYNKDNKINFRDRSMLDYQNVGCDENGNLFRVIRWDGNKPERKVSIPDDVTSIKDVNQDWYLEPKVMIIREISPSEKSTSDPIVDLNDILDPSRESETDWNCTEIDQDTWDYLDEVGVYHDGQHYRQRRK